MKYLLLFFFGFLCLNLSGQDFVFPKPATHIYPIPAKTVERLLSWQTNLNQLSGLGTPYPAGTDVAKLPPGHYLRTSLYGEKVDYEYFHTYAYEASIEAADGKFQLCLHGPDGKERADAEVTADGKPVRYSKKHRAYRRRDWRIDDLRIIIEEDTLFYRVDEEIEKSRFAHDVQVIGSRQPFRTLKLPYYYGRAYYRGLKSGIVDGYWRQMRYVPYPLKNTISRIKNPKPLTGYVSTSQPRYRPGDTLRLSAYLAYAKGRPLGVDSVDMRIYAYGRGARKQFHAKVGGNEKGRYSHAMAIPPDWPLDQDYTVSFSLPGWRWRDVDPTIRFKLQDYELAEYELSTKVSDDARLPGSAWIDVKAQDINGLPLPNGELKITVHLENFVASRDSNTLVLPDTLHLHTEPTDNRKDRRIILPDSLFPQGHSVRIRVATQLTGPSGEYKEAENTFTVDRRYARIPMIEIRGDSLLTFFAPAAEPVPASPVTPATPAPPVTPASPPTSPLSPGEGPGERAYATLETITYKNDTLRVQITLPHTQKLNHQLTKYRLLYNEQTVEENLTELSPITGSPAYWSRDTLLLSFPNPNAQPLRWKLYEDGQTIAEGDQDSQPFIRSGFSPGAPLQLHYAYLAGGTWQHVKTELSAPRYDLQTEHKNVLDLQLTQPAKVTPGETVRVALTATDQKGRPAANVRLTAGTFNARFDKTPVTTPTYSKRNKRRRKRQDYQREAISLNRSETPPGWLVEDFGLDAALAYRLRYPDGEFTFQRDLDTLLPNRVQHAHFAPFVIKGHQPVTIRTVYADDRLVYWWHPDITTPYSIPVDSGWHEISLRTDKEIFTKKLYFESCRQLVLSFDSERWVRAGWARTRVQEWDKEAVDRIWDRVFALSGINIDGDFRFRVLPDGIIHSARQRYRFETTPLGLAANNDLLRFYFPDHDSVDLRFEPRASYRVSRKRDRLYPLESSFVSQGLATEAKTGPAAPGIPLYTLPPAKKAISPNRRLAYAGKLPRIVPLEPMARVQFYHLPDTLRRIVVAPVDQEKYFYAGLNNPNAIAPGTYDVLYHFRNDSVFHQRIEFPEDSLTLLAFRRENVRHFNNFNRFKGYSSTKPAKKVEEVILRDYYFGGDEITGTVISADGEPLIGVSILIKDTHTGTVTDIDGNFSLDVPTEDFSLIFSYTGYATEQLNFKQQSRPISPLVVLIEESTKLLEEIVVVGYGTMRKANLTGSVQTVTAQGIEKMQTRNIGFLAGRAAGVSITEEGSDINIRGSRSNTVDYYVDGVRTAAPGSASNITIRGVGTLGLNNPLYILDGKIITDISQLSEDQIASINVLKDASATAIYGARGANGVVIITSKSGASGSVGANLPPANLRESFSDYAAYVPEIRTDRRGKAFFDVTFPDDITAWNTFAVGQDRKRRIGFALKRTNAFLPLQAQLYLPRFLVEGDRGEAATLAINREGGERSVRLTFEAVSPLPRTSGGSRAAKGAGEEGNERNVSDTTLVDAIENRYPIEAPLGADSITYQFTVQTLDGDQASDGERRTLPVYPKGTEMVSGELLLLTDATTALPAEFIRPERGPVTLRLPGNRVQQLLNDLEHIVNYPYACTEQTASRLIGLLQLSAVRKAQGEVFQRAVDIPKMILRLEKLRRPDGGFGWWGSSKSSSSWISLHVYRALSKADADGHAVADLRPIRRYLLGQLPELPVRDQLQIMLVLGEEGNPPTEAEIIRVDTFSAPNDYELLAVTRLRQLRGDTVDVQQLLDSSSTHAALGRYWGRRGYFFYRQPLDGRLACGLLAQRILAAADRPKESAEAINYMLGQSAARNRPGNVPLLGTNTLESAQLLAELLPTLLAEDGALSPPAVTLRSVVTPRSAGTVTRVTEFPFETEVPTNSIADLRMERAGSGPLPVALYQRWFETEPVAKDDGFRLTSKLTDKRGRPLTALKQGETAYLEVTVVSQSDADYVLVEVPIPGGCSYQDRNERQGPFAVHREYRRDRVAIFCDRLPAGSHTYRVALAPRFSGTYALNPARAEMQYLPVVNGNDRVTTVVVK